MTDECRRRGTLTGERAALVAVLVAVLVGGAVACGSDTADPEAATTSRGTTEASPTASGSATAEAGSGASPQAGAGAGTPTGATEPYCGASRYVEEITVQRWEDGGFRVSLRPTSEARHADDRDQAATEMWEAVRSCAAGLGLDGAVGESLQDQLRCHEYLALIPAQGEEQYATGETFDLESWRPTPGRSSWITTRCGNTLGTDPTSPPAQTYRPDGVAPQHTTSGELS